MFKISNLEFEVDSAVLSACYFDEAIKKRLGNQNHSFLWYLEIEMLPQEILFSEEDEEFYEEIEAVLYHNNGFSLPVQSWQEIEGIVKTWDTAVNELNEEAGTLYTFEHEDVTSGKIEFMKRMDQDFYVRWSGKANLYWNEEYNEDVPFVFEGIVHFEGITAQCDEICSFEQLQLELKQWINIDEFVVVSQESHEVNDGETYQWQLSLKG